MKTIERTTTHAPIAIGLKYPTATPPEGNGWEIESSLIHHLPGEDHVVWFWKRRADATEIVRVDLSALTEREKEVLKLLALGHTVKEAAKALFVSHKTIETHKARMYRKLAVRNSAELHLAAMRGGLIE